MAERLLIHVWLASKHGDRHSFRRTCRDGIEHMLVSFVEAPAVRDQSIPEPGQDFLIHVRQVVTPTNRGDFFLTGSLANKVSAPRTPSLRSPG